MIKKRKLLNKKNYIFVVRIGENTFAILVMVNGNRDQVNEVCSMQFGNNINFIFQGIKLLDNYQYFEHKFINNDIFNSLFYYNTCQLLAVNTNILVNELLK